MAKQQTLYLDGKKFRSELTFCKEVKELLFLGHDVKCRSLDVANDVLYGGYGILNCNEKYTVVWQNYKRSVQTLEEELLERILDIFRSNTNITLILE